MNCTSQSSYHPQGNHHAEVLSNCHHDRTNNYAPFKSPSLLYPFSIYLSLTTQTLFLCMLTTPIPTYLSSFGLPGELFPSLSTFSFLDQPTLHWEPGGKSSVHLYGSWLCQRERERERERERKMKERSVF